MVWSARLSITLYSTYINYIRNGGRMSNLEVTNIDDSKITRSCHVETVNVLNVGKTDVANIGDAGTVNLETVQNINVADRGDALRVIAQIKVAHNITNHELGLECAVVRLPLGNPKPCYEKDDGALSSEQVAEIKNLSTAKGKTFNKSLLDD